MKREDIEKILETDEELKAQIGQILNLHHAEIDNFKTELAQVKEDLGKQIEAANETIESLGKTAIDKDKYDELKNSYEEQIADLVKERDEVKMSNAIELAIIKANGRNSKAIQALLDKDQIKLEKDGSISGIEEQLKSLAKSDSYLFESKGTTGAASNPAQPPNGYKGPRKDHDKDSSDDLMKRLAKDIMSKENVNFNISKE